MTIGRACGLALVSIAWLARTLSAQTPTADDLVTRASGYVEVFIGRFSNVVAEERYLQENTTGSTSRAGQRRELKSDFLLILPPDSALWIPFRDVFEVDGRPVRDREERLTKILLQPTSSALERANQIAQESARYNLDAQVKRTINNPLLALAFIQGDNRRRFRYEIERRDAAEGSDVWIVASREQSRPTLIRGAFDKDLPAKGRYWIDGGSGRVIRTEVVFEDPSISATLTTDFRRDDRFGIDVPVSMRELYRLTGGREVTGIATYGRFRRFGVSTEEQVDTPR
jgi:hypothetical protein